MYDLAIIGGGPAGVSAAITAKISNLDFVWFGSGAISKKVKSAELIKNYPGLPDISGEELGWAFKNHAESLGINLKEEIVSGVYDTGGKYTLIANNEEFEARAVILCVGVEAVKPIDGEEKFLGRGVSYCATCDGMLYRGKNIAVVSYDKRFEHEIDYLCSLAKSAVVMPLYKDFEVSAENAKILVKSPLKIDGGERAERLIFKDGEEAFDGVFILKCAISPSTLLHGLKMENGHIAADRTCATNLKGVFAAGDCTGRPYQYVKAAGEGNVAAHSAAEYIAENKKN